MRSLRVQLLLGTAVGMVVVLVASGAVLYALIDRTLRAEFDASLAAKARSLTALAEQEEDGLELELTEVSLPEFEPSEHAEYYQVWLSDGTVFARSAPLEGGALERMTATSAEPEFGTARLPDGRPGRLVGMTFTPRQEYDEGDPGTPMTVTLVIGRDTLGLEATLAHVRAILIGVCLVAVVLSTGVLVSVIGRCLRPVDRLGEQIAAVGASDLSARFEPAEFPRELSPVVDRLNDLLARLEAAFQRERRFTGDVAHELRTPLAGLRSKLELALSRDREAQAYRDAVRDCLEIDLQMQRMVQNLLHLARADAGQLVIQREPVDLATAVRECWTSFDKTANARSLTVELHLNTPGTVETDRDNLRLVLQNVLENAVLHADEGGNVAVEIAEADDLVTLTVSNTGRVLSADQVHQVFERFWRGDASCQGAGRDRCGLGLPLCKAVIERLGGSIEATGDEGGLFSVTIRLPPAAPGHHDHQPADRSA